MSINQIVKIHQTISPTHYLYYILYDVSVDNYNNIVFVVYNLLAHRIFAFNVTYWF